MFVPLSSKQKRRKWFWKNVVQCQNQCLVTVQTHAQNVCSLFSLVFLSLSCGHLLKHSLLLRSQVAKVAVAIFGAHASIRWRGGGDDTIEEHHLKQEENHQSACDSAIWHIWYSCPFCLKAYLMFRCCLSRVSWHWRLGTSEAGRWPITVRVFLFSSESPVFVFCCCWFFFFCGKRSTGQSPHRPREIMDLNQQPSLCKMTVLSSAPMCCPVECKIWNNFGISQLRLYVSNQNNTFLYLKRKCREFSILSFFSCEV